MWRQDSSRAAEPRAKLARRALRWALEALVCQRLSVARVAEGLAVSWNTANNAVLAEGGRVLIADPARFDGVAVIGVDEHVWRHTRRGDKYVTVIIDLTPVRDGTGPARLLDMVEGRSKKAFRQWLADRPQDWRDRVEVVAMDGFSGFRTAAAEELPEAVVPTCSCYTWRPLLRHDCILVPKGRSLRHFQGVSRTSRRGTRRYRARAAVHRHRHQARLEAGIKDVGAHVRWWCIRK